MLDLSNSALSEYTVSFNLYHRDFCENCASGSGGIYDDMSTIVIRVYWDGSHDLIIDDILIKSNYAFTNHILAGDWDDDIENNLNDIMALDHSEVIFDFEVAWSGRRRIFTALHSFGMDKISTDMN